MNQICPWASYTQATVSFCESQLCAIIVKPAETWSNIGYVIVGIYLIWLCFKEKNQHLLIIGIAGVFLGIGSGLFHATGTFFGEFLDVSGMFLYTILGIVFGVRRLFHMRQGLTVYLFVGLQLISMAVLWFIKPIGIGLFSVLFTAVLLMEIALYRRDHLRIDYKYFFLFLASFGIAWGVWWLDILKILCDPNNHIFNGHAFWHLLTAFTFYFNYQHLKQFPELRRKN